MKRGVPDLWSAWDDPRDKESHWPWGLAQNACVQMGMDPSLPMSPAHVVAILAYLSARGYSARQTRRVWKVVSIVHNFGGHADPCEAPAARRAFVALASTRVIRKLGTRAEARPSAQGGTE